MLTTTRRLTRGQGVTPSPDAMAATFARRLSTDRAVVWQNREHGDTKHDTDVGHNS